MNHTPAPWALQIYNRLALVVSADRKTIIATAQYGNESERANASLIVSAPSLYQVCRRLVSKELAKPEGVRDSKLISGLLSAICLANPNAEL